MVAALSDRYRPQTLADLRGQPVVVCQLREWLKDPCSQAFLFEGGTGVGKTSAAHAFARELGVDVANGPFGGLYEIASGEQTGESVRALVRNLEHWPMTGSGWRVAIVNEADCSTPGAQHVWLDALEALPERCVVIFTTNDAGAMPARWRDRCERVTFNDTTRKLKEAAQAMIAEVWALEGGGASYVPTVDDLGGIEEGKLSFRRVLQNLGPALRRGKAGAA